MSSMLNLVDNSTALVFAILIVAGLTFISVLVFDTLPLIVRTFLRIIFGLALLVIGVGGFYIGVEPEIQPFFLGVYFSDLMYFAWMAVGVVAVIVGAVVFRQAFSRR